jgi:4-hydroxybenzoate polyprenyltransferase
MNMLSYSIFSAASDKKANRELLRLLFHASRLHIAALAAMGVFTFGWLFLGSCPLFLTAVCALDWYIVNLANRIVDLKEDRANAIAGTELVFLHRRALLISAIFLLATSIVAVHLVNPAITGLRISCHVLGVFYNWPLLPGKRRLKQLYFWKNTASVTGFLLTVFGYPLATLVWNQADYRFPPDITWVTVWVSGLFFFLFVLSYEIIYDLRDIKGDKLAGINTYPVAHGEQTAGKIIDALLFGSIVIISGSYALDLVPWRIFIMVSAPILQYVIYKKAFRRGMTAKDCTFMTWLGVGMFIIYHLWILANLPGSCV